MASGSQPRSGDGSVSTDADSWSGCESSKGSSEQNNEEQDFEAVNLLADLVPTSPEILRATTAAVPLAHFGAMMRESAGGAVARGDGIDRYSRSFATKQFDEFWSHSWHGPTWEKVFSLLVFYNLPAALVVSSVASCAGASVQLWAPSTRIWSASLLSFCPACLGFYLTLLLWQPRSRVFLDSVCICQTDKSLKEQGIKSLGGFLRHSRSMLILWDPSYCGRLWCVFEQAAFYFLQTMDPAKRVYVRPTFQASSALLVMTCVCVRILVYVTVEVWTGSNYYMHSLTLLFLLLVMAPHLRKVVRDVAGLSEQLASFAMDSTECFCCRHNHCHPITQEELACDRLLVEASVRQWFGSVEHFDQFVRTEVRRRFRVQCGNPYRIAVLWTFPQCWSLLGVATHHLGKGDAERAFRWVVLSITAVFFMYPCVLEAWWGLAWVLRGKSSSGLVDACKSLALAVAALCIEEGIWFVFLELARDPPRWSLISICVLASVILTMLLYWPDLCLGKRS